MKYEGTRPSGVDRDVMVHKFTMGKREVGLLVSVCQHYYENMPSDMETFTAKRRLANILKGLRKSLATIEEEVIN